jgi:hypothetical protein
VIPSQLNDGMDETDILVQSALKRSPEKDSVLFKEWEMGEGYNIIPTDSVHSHAFVLEIGDNKISVAVPYSDWPREFTDTSY